MRPVSEDVDYSTVKGFLGASQPDGVLGKHPEQQLHYLVQEWSCCTTIKQQSLAPHAVGLCRLSVTSSNKDTMIACIANTYDLASLLGCMSAAVFEVSVLKAASWTAFRLSDRCLNRTLRRKMAFVADVTLVGCF